ncbi:MAG: hypothetical protein M9956_03190 [Shinella sp.]|nr:MULTISPECIES: hypothetical protein [unclassified Shinella]MCO5148965.1 hypothetical protein [Shinella sp.]
MHVKVCIGAIEEHEAVVRIKGGNPVWHRFHDIDKQRLGTASPFDLLVQGLFGGFALGDIVADRDIGLYPSIGTDQWHDGCIHPIKIAVLGTVADLSVPDLTIGDRSPNTLEKRLRVVPGIDETVRLPDKLVFPVAAYCAELPVGGEDPAAPVRDGDDGVPIKRRLIGTQQLRQAASLVICAGAGVLL